MQKLTAGPYGQRTKINYRKSIAQYIVFVKNIWEKRRLSDAFPTVYSIKYILRAMRSGSLSKTVFYHTGK